jgi:protein Mpv17
MTLLAQEEWHSTEEVRFSLVLFSSKYTAHICPTAVFGPAATTWFKFLQHKVVLPNKNLEIVARVACDQLFFASTNLFCFLSSMAIMEGTSPKDKLEKTYWKALSANWMVWPFIQIVNFKFVPLHHRVLLVNVLSIGWNCFLSMINSGDN